MRTLGNYLTGALVALNLSLFSNSLAFAEPVLNGYVCSERVHKLTSDITWFKSLDQAEQAAHSQGKLIFWVHMLGKIDGAT